MKLNPYSILKRTIPIIALRGVSVFPYMIIHFDVGRDKSVNALEKAMVDDSLILLCSQKDPKIDEPGIDDFYHIGTVSKIKQMLKLPGGSIRVLIEGLNRGRIVDFTETDKYFEAEIEELTYDPEKIGKDKETEAIMRLVLDDFQEYTNLSNRISQDVIVTVAEIEDPGRFADIIASYIYLKPEYDQKILEAFDFYERLEILHKMLQEEIEILRIKVDINQRVKKQITQVQKEYYLREEMKAIQKELGEEDEVSEEVESYKNKIKKVKMPKEVRDKAITEAERLYKLSPGSPETGVIRTYLDWIIELPWDKETKDKVDLKKAREILNKDHYGLTDVKERILEYIAIRKLSGNMKGPILCFVGPPGVGKTSIAKSIAKSLNRNFVRMSLGGIQDEAEIRGHRRTYVGAMPGRIISLIKKAGSKNPVFLFDEIDKLNRDFRGDPASALLEVLDPEQNNSFTDHFLEVPFDMSKVFFITTANTTMTIPDALLDRMEVIRISGYTEEEKLKIAEGYLLPKQIKENGLKMKNLYISETALKTIISNYTREAGVRNLERNIANICRKSAKRIVEENINRVRINNGNLHNYLGVEKYKHEVVKEKNQVGIATGLAWTVFGGEILFIEVNCMKGTGKLQLTGQLGDVMKESAMAGISYIRGNFSDFGIDEQFYKDTDIHIHVPEGAIPKDGPSAGITMATAVISALSGKPIRRDTAMTGEITLRGRVLPIGGIKEKVLAASEAGIKRIILPYENKKDMEEVPKNIKKRTQFIFVRSMDEVLKYSLLNKDDKNENK
ncbi:MULTISPECIES: endopeptidase La [Tissierellales]|jgi:ATP-dependent Lon protease|uniref:Lon protease n=1 Tax=Acidilutibacter cellobiosedens TaxID=2507161 RepID=A0A410QF05_9FIRM|nr:MULTISPECIES: endopeptidase La [Tissierellales]MBE6082627.1 endopeptidase La [Tissierellaceae bacterium]QAT62505.1 endopeptidase La [Acidilutibacter cellobiosedens]SCL94432.1 Lon protease 1 [Sporanaerobacter sp. PP17-6a]